MKRLSTIAILTAAATFALATASFAGTVARNDAVATQTADPQTIAKL